MADEQLQDAIKLLQAGRREEARRQLMVLLRENPEDENAWLVLSAAVDDPVRRRQALETALEIDPENSIAQTQLKKLDPDAPLPAAPAVEEPEPVPVPEPGDVETLPDFDEGEAEIASAEEVATEVTIADEAPAEVTSADVTESEPRRRSRWWFLVLAGIPLLCLLVVLAIFLLYFAG